MKSFTIETANRFDVIREESCPSFNIQHTKPTEVNAINKPFQSNLKEKKKIKTKKVKKIQKKKLQKHYITDSNKTASFDKNSEQKVTRCNKCFVNHFPSLPKFCRWANEHADRNKRKNKKDKATGLKEINLVTKYTEMIESRINLIQEK